MLRGASAHRATPSDTRSAQTIVTPPPVYTSTGDTWVTRRHVTNTNLVVTIHVMNELQAILDTWAMNPAERLPHPAPVHDVMQHIRAAMGAIGRNIMPPCHELPTRRHIKEHIDRRGNFSYEALEKMRLASTRANIQGKSSFTKNYDGTESAAQSEARQVKLQVKELISQGFSVKDISKSLSIPVEQVKRYYLSKQ